MDCLSASKDFLSWRPIFTGDRIILPLQIPPPILCELCFSILGTTANSAYSNRQPILTGTSVVAIKYRDGVMMAADTQGKLSRRIPTALRASFDHLNLF